MGITGTAYLPSVTQESFGALHAHLVAQHGAKSLRPWTLSVRSLRRFERQLDDTTENGRFGRSMFIVGEDSEHEGVAFTLLERTLASTGAARYTVFASSSESCYAITARSNLPSPLGANASSNVGPGAWINRGNVLISGTMFEMQPTAPQSEEWRVRLGIVSIAGKSTVGAIIEVEFLPLSKPSSPTSPLLPSYLFGLLPPWLVNGLKPDGSSADIQTSPVDMASVTSSSFRQSSLPWTGTEGAKKAALALIELLRRHNVV